MLTLSVYDRMLQFVSVLRGEMTAPRKFKDQEIDIRSIDLKIKEFITSVNDNSHVLYKMEYLGLLKQETMNNQGSRKSNKD